MNINKKNFFHLHLVGFQFIADQLKCTAIQQKTKRFRMFAVRGDW